MADRSLYNEDLTLSKLTVNNSTSSAASGYTAQQTVITPTAITATNLSGNALFLNATGFPSTVMTNVNGVMSSDNAIASNDYLYGADITCAGNLTIKQSPTIANDVVLSCPQNDVLNVGGSVIASGIGITSQAGAVSLSAGANSTLIVGNIVQTDAVGTEIVTLQNGANSTTLSASASVNNTAIASGNLTVGNATTGTITAGNSVVSPLFKGGIVCANWVPATPISCAPGLFTSTTCVIQNVPTNLNYANCVYSFQAQALNAQSGCVPVVFPSYTATLNGTNLTLTIYISVAAGVNSAVINYIGIMIINPGYGAVAP